MDNANQPEAGPETAVAPTSDPEKSDRANIFVRVGRKTADGPIQMVSFHSDIFELLDSRREQLRAVRAEESVEGKSASPRYFESPLKDFFDATLSFILASDIQMSFGEAMPHAHMETLLKTKLDKEGVLFKDRPLYKWYALPVQHEAVLQQFGVAFEAHTTFSRRFPGMLLSALIAQYDAFLSRIIEAVYYSRPEIADGLERPLAFSELMAIGSLEEARKYVVESEAEKILRDSHDAQLKWFEKKCDIHVRKHVADVVEFLEICERRNLATHTDGRVSSTYIANCKKLGVKLDPATVVGSRLDVTPAYYRRAVAVVFEIGYKLGITAWEKLVPSEIEEVESNIIYTTFELIKLKRYKLAANILDYVTQCKKTWCEDRNHWICLVNHANALKLSGKKEDALKVLSALDWSSKPRNFRVCVAAVRDDAEECAVNMRALGKTEIGASDYQSWPVFETVRSTKEFQDAYRDVFGEPIQTKSGGANDNE